MASFGLCMLNSVYAQIKLIIVSLHFAAKFSAAIGQYADYPHFIFRKEWKNLVIKQVSLGDWCLCSVQLARSTF